MHKNRLAVCVLASLSGLAMGQVSVDGGTIFSGGAGDGLVADGGYTQVRTGQGILGLAIENPAAKFSIAQRDPRGLEDKFGNLPRDLPAFGLTNTVIVRNPDMGKAAVVLGDLEMKRHPAAPGFYTVETANVGMAVTLADALAGAADETYVDADRPKFTRGSIPSDPSLNSSWHGRNLIVPLYDSDTDSAWLMGYSGQGVVVGVIDGGNFETSHEDLSGNYFSSTSIATTFTGSHATAVAGIIGAVGNNGLGSAGIAYNSDLSNNPYGSDSFTATQFGAGQNVIDIKNNSWGPFDNGTQGPWSSVEKAALENNAANGRSGLGVVYAWAGGNGGNGDWAGLDNYVNSKYTIGIGAIGDDDDRSSYSEGGACILVTAHSNGGSRGIFSTDRTGGSGYSSGNYTSTFGGTSAASPHAAGVFALILEANPALTLRDVQHILVESSRKNDPGDSSWRLNGAGKDFSDYYGFGAVDAAEAVMLAETWVNVGPEVQSDSGVVTVNQGIPDNSSVGVTQNVTVRDDLVVEHVEVIFNIQHPYTGDLRITVTSPEGTTSTLKVPTGDGTDNFVNWNFTSVQQWGESALGIWEVKVTDQSNGDVGVLQNFRLIINGTTATPDPVFLPLPITEDWDLGFIFEAIFPTSTGTQVVLNPPGATPPSGQYVLELDSFDELITEQLLIGDVGGPVDIAFELRGDGLSGSDQLIVEIENSDGTNYTILEQILSTDLEAGGAAYKQFVIPVPAGDLENGRRVKIRTLTFSGGAKWYLDDLYIGEELDITPVACNPADLNGATAASPAAPGWGEADGILTPTDFTAFSFFYGTGDLRADLNTATAGSPAFPGWGVPDGQLTPTDFSAFSFFYGTGCP